MAAAPVLAVTARADGRHIYPSDRLTGVRLIASLSKALAASHAKAGDLALNRAEVRLAKLLVNLAETAGQAHNGSTHIALGYSRREIAEMIGVSTETAARAHDPIGWRASREHRAELSGILPRVSSRRDRCHRRPAYRTIGRDASKACP
jgi:hypothetical protein